MVAGIGIGKLISFALGLYVIAYVAFDAILAAANKTGFVAGSSLATLATTVVPILAIIGVVWLIYKNAGIER